MDELARASEWENSASEYEKGLGWTWSDVSIPPWRILQLISSGYVRKAYTSNSKKCYLLTEKGQQTARNISAITVVETESQELDLSDLFKNIYGHDEIKELISAALKTDKPVHVLLAGKPSLAKTIFLWELERLPGSRWVVGSGLTKAGLWDLFVENLPRVLLIDELDKLPTSEFSGLLSIMEGGRIVRTVVGRSINIQHDVWVFAACNEIVHIPREVLSRFAIKFLKEYDDNDFREVVASVLVNREGLTHDKAVAVANKLIGKTHDVRQAVRVARLSKIVGVEHAVQLLG